VQGVHVVALGRVRPKGSVVLGQVQPSGASPASSGKFAAFELGAAASGGIVPASSRLPVVALSDTRVLRATPAHYDPTTGETVPAEVLVLEPSSTTSLPTTPTAFQTVYTRGGVLLVISGGAQS
jgi:hypothetical protein